MEKSCLMLFPILFINLLLACFAMAATNISTDQYSLLSLKGHITSDPYGFLSTNWSVGALSVCDWIGVTCDTRQQRVVAINISNMGLVGTIPPNVGNLSFLVSLDFSSNNFSGDLPGELARLQLLQVLNFRNNDFSGEIPPWFGSLHRLRIFSLDKNQFTGAIPPSIFNLSNLEELRLAYNSLEGSIPGEIGNLRSLKILTTGFNYQLTGPLPVEIFNISSLESIWSSGNRLHGSIPYYVCKNLPGLKALDLTGSKLYGPVLSLLSNCSQLQWLALAQSNFADGGIIPQEIVNMKALEVIYLGDCNLTGEIPKGLSNLTKLRTLSLRNNFLTGTIPREIFNINSSLDDIDFLNNGITGTLPDNICDYLPRLKIFTVAINSLSGQIPPGLARCTALQSLYLDANDFEGSIPREFGNLTMLESLALQYNRLTGTIPQELGNLSNLKRLFLLNNNFRGPVPFDAFANCKNLTEFRVGNNPLNGVLPDSVGNLSSTLQVFAVFNCQIKGSIPATIGNLKGLGVLDLSWNEFSGMMPLSLKLLQNIQVLDLRRNKLSGVMIDRLCGLKSLSEVYLEYNEISGPISECLGNIASLRHLSLGSNRLDGSIPRSFGNLKDLIELNLSSNILSGSLPFEFGNLEAATLIDLSMNNISGSLPISIGYLLNLQTLNLADNMIQGSIPNEMGDAISLESLDLSHNNLSGSIPKSLEKLHYLKFFNVSSNYLSGEIPDGGPFSNFGSGSFASNKGFCGPQRLLVPPCPPRENKRKVDLVLILLVGIAVFVVLVTLGFVYFKCRKKNDATNGMNLLSPGRYERFSYNDIQQATEGCDEKNLLGKGSFGSVYKGILRDGRVVAVKVFNLHVEKASRSFDVECLLFSQLRHRNLAKVISSCSITGFKALVLEYMTNGSLEQWLYSEGYFLNLMERLNIMIDVASALDYLHTGYSTTVVHCDLKPSNILLDENMVAHVSDFGIAKLLGHEDSITWTRTLAALGYLAPEYGLEGLVSTKCDVYSYGILLMEVFTRRTPNDDMFEGNFNLRAFVHNSVINSLAPVVDDSLLSVDGKYSGDLLESVASIMKVALNCTKDSPKDRITMAEVIVAMERVKLQIQPFNTKI